MAADRRGSPDHMPAWVKVSVVVAGLVILLVAILALTGVLGGQHGPGRHLPGGSSPRVPEQPGSHTPPVEHAP